MASVPHSGSDKRASVRQVSLSDSVRNGFRDAVCRCLEADDGDRKASIALRRAARNVCAEGVRAEHVVRMIRTIWYETYPTLRPTVDHDIKLVHLIGTALDAYFADEECEQVMMPAPRGD